jgi:hypothetical protein
VTTSKAFVRGIKETVGTLKGLPAHVRKAIRAEVNFEAEKILTEARTEVPVKTGNLKNSAFKEPNSGPDKTGIELGFRADYAVYVHEIDKNYTVGKWKYLEDPFKRALPGMAQRIAEGVQTELEGALT